ncbi:nuclear transport factor 2 family protein [Hymenobacter terrenus]|uniref:nuclear transport factor 2 family protein n=1 Tax=Hymenobacter terrenus TaxID=1629124 RepID=UPI00069614FD|nr:nuclear transport factor 2 family protein [Hymenobacter terrenus]
MSNVDIIREMYRLFAAGDTESIRRIFDPQVRWNMMAGFPGGGRYVGINAVFARVFPYFCEFWNDWKAHSTRLIAIDDGVLVIGYYEGTYKATGRYVRAEFAAEYQIQDGKITEYNQYTDTQVIAEAMVPAPTNAGAAVIYTSHNQRV